MFAAIGLRLRARHWPGSAGVCLVSGVASAHWFGVAIDQPFGSRQLPVWGCLPLALSLAAVYPLVDWWSPFSRQVVRENPTRSLQRVLGSGLLLVLGAAPTGLVAGRAAMENMVILAAIATALSLTSLSLLGELYWLPVTAAALACLPVFLKASATDDVSSWLSGERGASIAAGVTIPAACAYVWHSRSRSRSGR